EAELNGGEVLIGHRQVQAQLLAGRHVLRDYGADGWRQVLAGTASYERGRQQRHKRRPPGPSPKQATKAVNVGSDSRLPHFMPPVSHGCGGDSRRWSLIGGQAVRGGGALTAPPR